MSFRFFALVTALALVAAVPDPTTIMRAQGAPGLQLVVVDHGRIVTDRAYGVRNVDTQMPVDVHTRFEIGSITKQFTAAAILQLKERGLLSLDDRLGTYFPRYAAARNITLRQMLLQVSGIPNFTNTKGFSKLVTLRGTSIVITRTGSIDAILALIDRLPLDFKPGTKWEYSNSNYVLLGQIVAMVSHVPWETYVRTHIFVPAGMTDSAFMDNEPSIADMATGYGEYKGQLRRAPSMEGWAAGAGAIVSTATDLAKWDAALFGGKIISRADLYLMLMPGTLPAMSPHVHYAFGWVVDRYDGQPRVWHNGGTLAFRASNQIYLPQGQWIIVLANNADADADAIADAVFEQLHPQLARRQNVSSPGEDPAVTALVKTVFGEFIKGSIDRSQFDATMNSALAPAVLAQAQAQFTKLGAPQQWVYQGKRVVKSVTLYTYRVTFQSGVRASVYIGIDAQGKIAAYLVSGT